MPSPFLLTSGTLGAGRRTTFSSNTFSLMRTQATFREPRRALGLNAKVWPSGENSSRVCTAGFSWKWLHSSTRRSISALLRWRGRERGGWEREKVKGREGQSSTERSTGGEKGREGAVEGDRKHDRVTKNTQHQLRLKKIIKMSMYDIFIKVCEKPETDRFCPTIIQRWPEDAVILFKI